MNIIKLIGNLSSNLADITNVAGDTSVDAVEYVQHEVQMARVDQVHDMFADDDDATKASKLLILQKLYPDHKLFQS